MADTKKVPSDEGKTNEQPPEDISSDNGEQKTGEAPLEVPENLRGKSVEELTQMYQNLEKKLGEQSTEVGDARKKLKEADETKKNIEVLLGAIYADPDRYKTASGWIQEYLGGTQAKTETSEGSGEAKTGTQSEVKTDDTRRALQNQILADFYKKHGLDQLPEDERKVEQTKVANAFADLVDPGGKKPVMQLLNEVPLDRLPRYLESAYLVSNAEKVANEIGQKGFLATEENRQASIGSLSSASGQGEEKNTLTAEEREVARKLKISPEDYAKKKAELSKEK